MSVFSWNVRLREIAARYLLVLAPTLLTLPAVRAGAEPVWHLFVVQHPQRDRLRALLASFTALNFSPALSDDQVATVIAACLEACRLL